MPLTAAPYKQNKTYIEIQLFVYGILKSTVAIVLLNLRDKNL